MEMHFKDDGGGILGTMMELGTLGMTVELSCSADSEAGDARDGVGHSGTTIELGHWMYSRSDGCVRKVPLHG